jgi:hypothetical protein
MSKGKRLSMKEAAAYWERNGAPRYRNSAMRWRLAADQGKVTVIGVGQGPVSKREALPRQLSAAQMAKANGIHLVTFASDADGERGIAVTPNLPRGHAVDIGRKFGQRSVIVGLDEVGTQMGDPVLTEFNDVKSGYAPTGKFYTHLPTEGVYFSLVKPHTRSGRKVSGYATRRRRKVR